MLVTLSGRQNASVVLPIMTCGRLPLHAKENDYSYEQDRAFSAPLMILLLVSISTVFGCGVIPGGQTSTRTFTASGPTNLC
ncbi:hypothetical protein KIN20_030778 [Parelaphostrongylus tenuis]|uniref:Uncharacterized protein n=1 Tax=Parelaphostrongylus tenuis TaxID=148309 RepID=A0AAD5R477_PARTN|nr:hypothetical protein KIN20_030778 [Parelaphostrongylus tenuis]